jgi:hypothetical protein
MCTFKGWFQQSKWQQCLRSIPPKSSAVVHFLWAKGLDAKDTHKDMFPAYSGKCLLCTVVHNWVDKFSQGYLKVADDAQPGRPVKTDRNNRAAGGRNNLS